MANRTAVRWVGTWKEDRREWMFLAGVSTPTPTPGCVPVLPGERVRGALGEGGWPGLAGCVIATLTTASLASVCAGAAWRC